MSNLSSQTFSSRGRLAACAALALAATTGLFGSRLFAAPAPTDRQTFGSWTVSCVADPMSHDKICTQGTSLIGRGPYGNTHLSLEIIALPRGGKAVSLVEPTFGWFVTRVAAQVDDGPVSGLACASVQSQTCELTEASRDAVLNGIESGKSLRLRMTIMSGRTYDFVFDLSGYTAGEAALNTASAAFLN